jgi:hypothetical protein
MNRDRRSPHAACHTTVLKLRIKAAVRLLTASQNQLVQPTAGLTSAEASILWHALGARG